MHAGMLAPLLLVVALAGSYTPTPPAALTDKMTAVETRLREKVQIEGMANSLFTLAERMEHYQVPGVSIAVIEDGKVAWAKGYGMANTRTGSLVDTLTLFQAGSISKPVAAMGALALADQGILTLDGDINTWLQEWKVTDNDLTASEKVTLRRLVTHTAGLTVHGFPGYHPDILLPTTRDVLMGAGNTAAVVVDATPGSLWRYSGGGYTVMQLAVEDLTGIPFETFLQQTVLLPLGMMQSTYSNPLPEERHAQASAAYDRSGNLIPGSWHNYPEKAAAGLWTTPLDLARYLIAIQEAVAGKPHPVLSERMIQAMLQPDQNNWGLGPALSGEGDLQRFGHGGKNAGFTNNMTAFVSEGKGAIVMTNADRGNGLIQEVLQAIAEVYQWPDYAVTRKTIAQLTPAQQRQIAGTYQAALSGQTRQINIDLLDDGTFRVFSAGILDEIAWPENDSLLFSRSSEKLATFQFDETGKLISGRFMGNNIFQKVP
jgi:CubicO group peptidase (beta-lactamase class C family)